MSTQVITPAEVAKHTTEESAWLIVDDGVYDVTKFLDDHPGGKKILLRSCGKDASSQFWKFHSKKVLQKSAAQFLIGKAGASAKL